MKKTISFEMFDMNERRPLPGRPLLLMRKGVPCVPTSFEIGTYESADESEYIDFEIAIEYTTPADVSDYFWIYFE